MGLTSRKIRPGPRGRIVAKCKEFKLYANAWLESSPEVERALWRATLNINDRGDSDVRLELALALLDLAEFAAGQYGGESRVLLKRLVATLGEMLVRILSVGPQIGYKTDGTTRYDSAKARLETAKAEAETVGASLKNAITALKSALIAVARWKHSRPEPGSKRPGSWVWAMQIAAKEIFRETHNRPTKAEIRVRMEEDGWRIRSRDANVRWHDRFVVAGLGALRDGSYSDSTDKDYVRIPIG